jgi:hypothetical protein
VPRSRAIILGDANRPGLTASRVGLFFFFLCEKVGLGWAFLVWSGFFFVPSFNISLALIFFRKTITKIDWSTIKYLEYMKISLDVS